MEHDELRQPEDNLFEEVSVVTALGASGAALFFREGGGGKAFNNALVKSKIYLDKYSRVVRDNLDDITQINNEMFEKAHTNAKKEYARLKDIGMNFRATDTTAIKGLSELYKVKLNANGILRDFYISDLRNVAIKSIDSIEGLPENIRSALLSNLDTLANSYQDSGKIFQELQKKLGKDTFANSVPIVNKIIDDVEEWANENQFHGTWYENKGKNLVRSYEKKVFDVDHILEQQEKSKKSITSRIDNAINPDKNLTIADIMEIEARDSDDLQRQQLYKIFGRDRVAILGTDNIELISDPAEKKRIASRFSETVSGKKNISLTALDLIRIHYKQASPEMREKLGQIEISGLLKNSQGEIYTSSEYKKLASDFGGGISKYFPFSMFRYGDYKFQQDSDVYSYVIKSGSMDAIAAWSQGREGITGKTIVQIGDKFYDDLNGQLVENTKLKGAITLSTDTGVMKEVTQAQSGAIASKADSDRSYLEKKLNIEFPNSQMSETNGSNGRLFTSFSPESIQELKGIALKGQSSDIGDIYEYNELLNRAKKFQKFVDKTTYGFSSKQAKQIAKALSNDDELKKYLDYIIRLDGSSEEFEDVMSELLKMGDANITYKNPELSKDLKNFAREGDRLLARFIKTKKDPYARKQGEYISLTFAQEIQDQLSKEFISRYGSKYGYSGLTDLMTNTFSGAERQQMLSLISTRKFLEDVGLNNPGALNFGNDTISEIVDNIEKLALDQSEEGNLLKSQLQNYIIRFSNNDDILGVSNKDKVIYDTPQRVTRVSQASFGNSQEIIRQINEGHFEEGAKSLSKWAKNFGLQFIGGNNLPEQHTVLGDAIYWQLKRLDNNLDLSVKIPFTQRQVGIDLRLKGKDVASTKNLLKAWGTKRIAPLMAAWYIFNWSDDATKATTGMGLAEAGASGLANSYLGIKRITGALGLDDGLKSLLEDNAASQYFGEYTGEYGSGWNTYEEQVDYYRNGYTPIRKARFWWFGSSNEFRGGRISYFEPNTLRSLASDYKDMSLYNGSYWNKYNPLNVLNPYYLEELHSEDRPYPVSGSLFEENTPWGVVLNPTLGAIIKPKRFLHSDRLSSDGVDVKALIMHMNSQIRGKANENSNLFYIQNGKMRSMDFMAYNAPTYSDRIISMNTEDESVQYSDYGLYNTPVSMQNELYQELVDNNQKFLEQNKKLTVKDKIAIEAAKGNQVAKMATMITGSSLNIIKNENNRILAQTGYDKSQGIMVENKLSAQVDPLDELLSDSESIAELMQSGSSNDYIHEMAVSARMITGLYGWGASQMIGIGQNSGDRIATSADMTSNSRAFWDMNLGGAGGEFMEITRRFIPEYRRFQTKNPLMNTMPDWIPERLRFGDPMTSLPNGEARLPGYGYESLNQLHPDNFGNYGAYDRFKILADVAPYSPEYKFWKNVASKTVQDPYLRQDMEKIKERVRLQTKQHDFQEYKYVGRDTDRRNAYITEVGKNGQFKVYGSDAVYKLAGARINPNGQESQEDVLKRYLKPGQLVSLVVDTNEAYARNSDTNRTINAAVLIDGEDVATMMKKNGDAQTRDSDTSAASVVARHGTFVNLLNSATERFMHMDLPVLHNRWFRANTALEDYQDEYIYGTSFQTWDDIWGTFIVPNMQKAANSPGWMAFGIATDIVRNNLIGDTKNNLIANTLQTYVKADGPLGKLTNLPEWTKAHTKAINRIQYMSDRGSLMGYLVGKFGKLGRSGQATLSHTNFRRAGNALTLGFAAVMAPENLAVSTMSWSRLGYMAANEFMGGSKYRLAAAGIGAAIGIARWAGSQTLLSSDPTANTYIPESAKKRWEMQDYFDRLNYVKYMALYEKAADKALSEENVDIKAILEKQSEETKNIKETKAEILQDLRDMSDRTDADAAKMRELLVQRMGQLTPSKIPLSGGEYTKSAIMYYNAAKSTMYALDETSSMADVIRALPKTDREYFMEFVKEKDEDKREEILSQVSPQIRKALNMFWYKKYDEPESNEEFFTKHALPAPTWSGWNPDVDLADVQAKVIKNEAMNYSDFGIYASQYRDQNVINAPNLDYSAHDSLIESTLKMKSILNGLGLVGVDVSVEPSGDSTIQVMANVARVTEYKLGESISSIFEGI